MGSYASLAVRDSSGTIIGYQSTSTGQIAYESAYPGGQASANYNSIVAAYGQQHYTTVGSSSGAYQQSQGYSLTPTYYDTSSAAGIAAQVGRYGALEYNPLSGGVALTAIAEGYNPNLVSVASATNNSVSGYAVPITSVRSLSEVRSGIDVAPTFDKAALAQGAALTVPASAMTGGTVTTYVPNGNYAQTELLGTKDIINPISGEIAIYQLSAGGYYYKLIGGGGSGALQSGDFTVNYPETSVVYTQNSAGKALAAIANATEAAKVLGNTSGYSRLGSEVYGGYVVPLTGETVAETGAQLSTYSNTYNLANLVSPQGVNLSKADMGLVSFPWTISPGTSAISTTTGKAITGYGSTKYIPSIQVAGVGPTVITKSGATQKSGGLTYTLLGTAGNILGKTEQKATAPVTLFEEISSTIQNLPVLSSIYSLGAEYGARGKTAEVQSFITSTPVLSSIYKGGGVFELKSDYESLAASTYSAQSGNILKYTTDVNGYNTRLNTYNSELATYNAKPTIEGYNKLTLEQADLSRQLSTLTTQKASIDAAIAPVKSAEKKYNEAASELTGNVDQSTLTTYGIGTAIGNLGKEYTAIIETPVSSAVSGWGIVGEFISGIANVPTQITTIGESALIGGETILRNAGELPALATAGIAMQIKGTYDLAITNPAYLIGSVVAMFAVGNVASGAVTKGINLVRTTGKTYVAIESIGYDVNEMYPIKPTSATAENLIQSFEEGKLIPTPKEM